MSEATQGVESTVMLTLAEKGTSTDVTLVHKNVPDDEMGRQHEKGWTWMLSMLAERFAK